MRKIFRRLAAAAVMLTAVVFEVPGKIAAASVVANGDCGESGSNVTWSLDSSGKMTISGSGAMKYYYSISVIPWYSYNSQITSVVINPGVILMIFDRHVNLKYKYGSRYF